MDFSMVTLPPVPHAGIIAAMITLAKVALPDFGGEELQPHIPTEIHEQRFSAALDRMRREELDFLVLFADREHFANLSYLTGVDPRFEEETLLLSRDGRKLFVAGNECMSYLPDERLKIDVELFQDFSLLGQQRGGSRSLREILASFGISRGTKVGCVGWKYYDTQLTGDTRYASDLPSYLIDVLRELTGDPKLVTNATRIFVDPSDGLRIVNVEPEQIALFEYAGAQTSRSMLAAMQHLKPGAREDEIEKYLDSAGLPLSCHRTIRFGKNARCGLASATSNRAELGDVCKIGFGIVGALTCRNGFLARGPEDLPPQVREFYPRFVANYFDVVAMWYENVRVGATGGDVFKAVDAKRDGSLFDFLVNPGHYIHLDEWTHSPFTPESAIELRSGMALQMDIIPVAKGPFVRSNVEDGVILADKSLRSALAEKFPGCWKRMQARRDFMANELGIRMHESVLPTSNIPAYLPPYLLSLDQALIKK